jgi:hypothetical protein
MLERRKLGGRVVTLKPYEQSPLYEPCDEEYFHRGSKNVNLVVGFSLTCSPRSLPPLSEV